MPLFFFDLYDGERMFRDEFGVDLDSVEQVADEAAALLPDMARDVLPDRQSHDFAALVRNEAGAVVYRAALLFRGQRCDSSNLWASRHRLEADDLVPQSRATRYAAREASAGLQDGVCELLDLLQDAFRLTTDIRMGSSPLG